ncbi:hypothetical protein [Agromyces larvae]|uniref:CHAP domain-containing protein n=1 Tax=Agromyces larvae TaxID=2929802 RepID=A0ABY4C349_9MICO|nr:hypothetical protein [Agromyces larvae]UOE45897.1 hypothetical protein MTO99_09200 [Agromyces larvae]
MPRTFSEVIAWSKNPSAAAAGEHVSWAGLCEEYINNSGNFNQAFSSALLAGNASGPLRTDYASAPAGAIVYWAGVGGDGHVAYIYQQDADPVLLMASSSVDEHWGRNIGLIRLSRYQAKFGHPLRGWTLRHGTETLAGVSAPAGGGTTPIPDEGADMSQGAFYRIKDGQPSAGAILWQDKPNTPLIPISLPTWVAYAANGAKYADLTADEVNDLRAKWGTSPAPAAITIDAAPIAAAIADAIKATGVQVDVAAIAKAVDAAVADDFAKVNANIDDQPTKFTITPAA